MSDYRLPMPEFPYDERKFAEALGLNTGKIAAQSLRIENLGNGKAALRYECIEFRTTQQIEDALNAAR